MKAKRTGISPKLRFDVFKRDGFTCQYCGGHPPAVVLQVDHIDPVVNGGKNNMDNLATSCDSCNLGKGGRLLSSVPMPLAEKAATIAEQEKQLKGYMKILKAQKDRVEQDAWEVADVYMERFSKDSIRKDYMRSIKLFLQKLPLYEVVEAMETATSRKSFNMDSVFRYFCGICWTRIRETEL